MKQVVKILRFVQNDINEGVLKSERKLLYKKGKGNLVGIEVTGTTNIKGE